MFLDMVLLPFFWLFRLLGVHVICNVDGIEWRRSKWSNNAKTYFKFCELMAAKSSASLIYDANGIQRYFKTVHRRDGTLAFYGVEEFDHGLLEARFDLICHEYKLSDAEEYVVVVMRMEPENNIKLIVEAFAESESNRQLILIGPSTDFFQENVLPIVKSDGRIRYLGPIYDRQDLMAIRRCASAYIHGHAVGGTNPTLVEAVSLRKPIVAFDSIFNREVLGSGTFFKTKLDLVPILNSNNADALIPRPLGKNYKWDYVIERYIELIKADK